MQWIDDKYIGSISNRLSMFKRTDDGVYNFRCMVCGDSRKSKTKARGYLIRKNGNYFFTCHNCSATMSFSRLLEIVDPELHKDYIRERFLENRRANTANIVEPAPDIGRFITPKFIKYTQLADLKRISQLDPSHPAKRYIMSRKIPSPLHSRLFYAPKFKAWTNTLIPNKFDLEKKDEPRLIIPFIDKYGNLFGYQGRSFGNVEPRYITIILDEAMPRVFGMDKIDLAERVYVTEGPIDSMFIPNCLAMGGSHLDKTTAKLGLKPYNMVIVYDNEPRNKEIVSAIEKAIDLGYNVCLWPEETVQKDVNEMIQDGLTPKQVLAIIDAHTYKGLTAKMKLTQWKKV
jgi:transcription elongation factor Elf1